MSWETVGLWAGAILPLWDIPLMVRIIRRQSSSDISLFWAWGIWLSSVLMAPSSFVVANKIAMVFNIVNVTTLTALLMIVVKYHRGEQK